MSRIPCSGGYENTWQKESSKSTEWGDSRHVKIKHTASLSQLIAGITRDTFMTDCYYVILSKTSILASSMSYFLSPPIQKSQGCHKIITLWQGYNIFHEMRKAVKSLWPDCDEVYQKSQHCHSLVKIWKIDPWQLLTLTMAMEATRLSNSG